MCLFVYNNNSLINVQVQYDNDRLLKHHNINTNRQRMYNVILRGVRTTIAVVEKRYESHILRAALSIQHAKCKFHTVICGLLGSTIFSTLAHKWLDFF
jgi:hypothetical protein